MCYNLESTLSRQNLFLDLLISSENTVSVDVRTKPQNKNMVAERESFFFVPSFVLRSFPYNRGLTLKAFIGDEGSY